MRNNPVENLRMEAMKYTSDNVLYYILNKDRVLASFRWESIGINLSRVSLQEDIYLPKFISDNLSTWVESRTPPKHRAFMDDLLEQLNLNSVRDIIDYSKGLSLNDTFWITNDKTLKWDDINLYDNEFDEVISKIAFDGGLHGLHIKTTSPEFGTNGMLPKCWVRDKDTKVISLKKGGTSGASNTGNEPYSEVLSSQILDVLEYDHAPYSLENFRHSIVSSCDLLTTKEEIMIPIYLMCDIRSIFNIMDFCSKYNLLNDLYKIFIFDFLTNNNDRHGNNFAVMLDSDTYKITRMAPIYDNGCALLTYCLPSDNLKDYLSRYTPALYGSYTEMAELAKRNLKNNNVSKLINFKFDRTKVTGYSDKKIDIIEEFLQERVKEFLAF